MLQPQTQEQRFRTIRELALSKHAGDLTSLLMFARVVRFYIKTLAENSFIEGMMKQENKFLFNAITRYINFCKKGASDPGIWQREVQDREFEAYAQVFEHMMHLSAEEIQQVETFTRGLATGRLRVTNIEEN